MRQIKFRAWFATQGIMIPHERLNMIYGHDEGFNQADDEGSDIATFNFELMQYTGLKDKNGVEIYEGDIVQIADHPFDGSVRFNGNYQVGYNEQMELVAGSLLLFRVRSYSSVIGNIYTNADLLPKAIDATESA